MCNKVELEKGERIEDLGCNNLKIIQNKDYYTFTCDSVILANFLKIKPREIAVEIGAGSGVVSILASAKNKPKKIVMFEIQEELQKLCEKNIILNNLSNLLELKKDDVLNFNKYFEKGSIDVVFSNPPYFAVDENLGNEVRKIARQEIKLNLENLIKVSSEMLKYKGRLYLVYPAERMCELVFVCMKNNLAIKKMFFTDNGKGKITLVVIEALKGGKDKVKILPTLKTNTEDGKFLEELKTRKFLS